MAIRYNGVAMTQGLMVCEIMSCVLVIIAEGNTAYHLLFK